MWPILVDMTKEESVQHLRCLEVEAFAGLVTALRAQGGLDGDKLKILKETATMLHISYDRHKAEIRRAVNDERLNTIAYHVNGERHSIDDWVEEGCRTIGLMSRVAPQTAYSAIADEVADAASKLNKQLPSPACTERKRSTSPTTHANASTSEQCGAGKALQFQPDVKKRKISENSAMSPHLMGPPKISKIQQIYRQKTKARQKELQQQQLSKLKPIELDKPEYVHIQQLAVTKTHQQIVTSQPPSKAAPKLVVNQIASPTVVPPLGSPKINILQNISIQSTAEEQAKQAEQLAEEPSPQPGCSGEPPPPPKVINKVLGNATFNKVNQVTVKAGGGGVSGATDKTIKVCAPRKTITSKTVTTGTGQKLLVVSNPQSLTTTSILQRTLTTVPWKNISVKNLDKFKIVGAPTTTTTAPPNSKQKVVTVRTTSNKKVLPFSQVQLLNTKGGIKVLPFGGKIISSSNVNTSSVYLVNSTVGGGDGTATKSTTSTPVLMSARTQEENGEPSKSQENSVQLDVAAAINDGDESGTNSPKPENVNHCDVADDSLDSVVLDKDESSGVSASNDVGAIVDEKVVEELEKIDVARTTPSDIMDGEKLIEEISTAIADTTTSSSPPPIKNHSSDAEDERPPSSPKSHVLENELPVVVVAPSTDVNVMN